MTIKTKLNIGDIGYFMTQNAIYSAKVEYIEVLVKTGETRVIYGVDSNPCGHQYTSRFFEDEIFETKQDLLNNLASKS